MPTIFLNLFLSRQSYNHVANFHEIFEWAPLLEQLSYKAAMRVLHVLDTLRLGRTLRIERNGRSRCHELARVLAARSCARATYPARLEQRLSPLARGYGQ